MSAELEEQRGRISRASVSRILRRFRSRHRRLPQKGAERANAATKGVPMKRIDWQTQEPGHVEVDLVHHSGQSTVGDYVHTLQMVDVATGWSERVVVMGRGYRGMQAGIEHILSRLPFEVKEVHPDNGSEFFNQHLVRFWKEKVVGVLLSRSRLYQKGENGLAGEKVSVWVYENTLKVEYQATTLSLYTASRRY